MLTKSKNSKHQCNTINGILSPIQSNGLIIKLIKVCNARHSINAYLVYKHIAYAGIIRGQETITVPDVEPLASSINWTIILKRCQIPRVCKLQYYYERRVNEILFRKYS